MHSPFNENPEKYFVKMQSLNEKLNLNELSMGMSADYLKAVEFSSTFLRIDQIFLVQEVNL